MTRALRRYLQLAGTCGSLLATLPAHPLAAQRPDSAFRAPVDGSWEPIRSLGQPSTWKPFAGLSLGAGREDDRDVNAYVGDLGIFRDLGRPLRGLLGWQAEAYAGSTGGRFDAGGRFLLRSQLLFVGGGVDYNLRREDLRGIVSFIFPPVRGGMFTRGGQVRVDWLPGADALILAGLTFPLAQPRIGISRPRTVEVEVPGGGTGRTGKTGERDSVLAQQLEELEGAARRVTRLSFLFWGLESGSSTEDVVRATEAAVRDLKAELAEHDSLKPGTRPHEREMLLYHESLERAFGLARGAPDSATALEAGWTIAEHARRFMLREVFFPYNRLIGRYKSPDTINGYAARARARFAAWLALECAAPTDSTVLEVFDAWVTTLESIRESLSDLTEDSRQNWLPMALVLRPAQHRTQAQIDALLADALGSPFSRGNALLYFTAQQFQVELTRSIHEAERYHVLWIHDYRGVDVSGRPDRVGFYQAAQGYLAALTRRVREYDATGRLPVYLLLLDQHYYDRNQSRLWMDLLENPLGHRVSLPGEYGAMAGVIHAWQDSLAWAVRDSHRMQAEAAAFGRDWIRQVVKVHVNITNPADFTFRTTKLLGLPIGSDELMRDHRKIVIRDVTEADPTEGEVMLAGVGVGDSYTSDTWEDRAVLLTGPVAADFKAEVREVLRRNGLAERDMPPPLRPEPRGPGWDESVAGLEAAGATARMLQAQNRTGWGEKDATFVQMFLWDLVPPGTVIYVPDSLWTNALWLAQLVSAALRGCEVYIVAPALANAPSAGFLQMSATRELFVSLFVVARDLGDVIHRSGGDLRVGLYTRRSPIGPAGPKLWEVDTTYAKYAFLRSQYPFPEATWQMLWAHRASLDSISAGRDSLTSDPAAPLPRMHRKTQFMASGELVHALAARPETHDAVDLLMRGWEEGITVTPETRPIPSQGRLAVARRLFAGYAALPPALRDSSLLYFIAGSLNKDTRGMALDGEAIAVVSGEWSLVAWLDFWSLFGSTTWIERLEELTELLPEQGWLQRWMSRRVRGLL
ncbi:MAG: hypothetical protein ACREMH_08765 [Gemmatimonadales bacterium]